MPHPRSLLRNQSRDLHTITSKVPSIIGGALIFLTLVAVGTYIYISRAFVDVSSVRIAVGSPQNEIKILIFDFDEPSASVISIPPATQVSVARQLGEWKAGSVWELGEDEGDKGGILADTVMKSFGIPIEEWAGEGVLGYISPNILSRVRAAFGLYDASLGIRERLALGLISIRIRSGGVAHISLEEFAFMREETLKDGSEGYVVRGELPSKIVGIFADPRFVTDKNQPLKIKIIDGAQGHGLATVHTIQNVSEVLGAKVVSIEENNTEIQGCLIRGRSMLEYVSGIMGHLFRCNVELSN